MEGKNKFAKIIISAENLFKKKMSYESVLHSVLQIERYKKNFFIEEFIQSENMHRQDKRDCHEELMSERSDLVKRFQILKPYKPKKLTK